MTDAAPTGDPFEPMRRSYEQALDAWSTTVEQMVGTERFAAASNQLLAQYVEMQKAMRDNSRAAADALHVPTKDDLAGVAELVVNVERKVDEASRRGDHVAEIVERLPLEGLAAMPGRLDRLDAALASAAAAVPPPAPDHTDALRDIAERLARLEEALEAVRTATPPSPPDPAQAVAPVLERIGGLEARLDALAAAAPERTPPADAVPAAPEPATRSPRARSAKPATGPAGGETLPTPKSPGRRTRTAKG